MKTKLKLYVDTSVWSFYFADDSPEYRNATRSFFDLALAGVYDLCISQVVLDEIDGTTDPALRQKLLDLVDKAGAEILPLEAGATDLGYSYIKEGVLPEKSLNDAMHVAVATLNNVGVILSWNFKHLANIRRNNAFNAANLARGYRPDIHIVTPLEVMENEL